MRPLLPWLLFVLMAVPLQAQTFRAMGEIRERSEYDRRLNTDDEDIFHLLRTRFGLEASLEEELMAFIELQDARGFGDTRTGAVRGGEESLIGLRQGYIQARHIGGSPLGVKVGRQALSYGNERLLGASEWSNFGQTFDAAVIRMELDSITVDLMGGAIAQRPNRLVYAPDAFLIGTWATWKPARTGASIHAFYLFDDPRNTAARQDRHTLGTHTTGAWHGLDYTVDGALQLGDMYFSESGVDRLPIFAYMAGTRLGYTFDSSLALRIGVGWDFLSGNPPGRSDAYRAFSTLYATNRLHFGAMEYFDDVPRVTEGLGLQSFAAQASVSPLKGLHLSAELHFFSLARNPFDETVIDPEMPPGVPSIPYSRTIGNEMDFAITYDVLEWLQLSGGYSIFNGDPDRYILRGRNTARWGFFSARARFRSE